MAQVLAEAEEETLGPQEENAAELVFPKEFDRMEPLMLSEVRLLLEEESGEQNGKEEDLESSKQWQQIKDYCKQYGVLKSVGAIGRVREVLSRKYSKKLDSFEQVQLVNLLPVTVEEAKALIPSLGEKFEDEELRTILYDVPRAIRSQFVRKTTPKTTPPVVVNLDKE